MIKTFNWNTAEELPLMTLNSDAKFKEKLTFGFKYGLRNMVNFHPTTQKSGNFTLMRYFLSKVYQVWT